MHKKQGGKTKICVYYANIMHNLCLSYVLSEIYVFSSCSFFFCIFFAYISHILWISYG